MKRIVFSSCAIAGLMLSLSIPASAQTPLLAHFVSEGRGTGTTSTASGTLTGATLGGHPMVSLTFDYSALSIPDSFSSNGMGGFCDRIVGTITLKAPDGSTLAMQHGGQSCNTGVGQASAAIDQSVYIVISGTGIFANAIGTGTFSLAWYNAPEHFNQPALVLVHVDGNLATTTK